MKRRDLFRLALASPAAFLVAKYGVPEPFMVSIKVAGLVPGSKATFYDCESGVVNDSGCSVTAMVVYKQDTHMTVRAKSGTIVPFKFA